MSPEYLNNYLNNNLIDNNKDKSNIIDLILLIF